jgi:hypothetical protein
MTTRKNRATNPSQVAVEKTIVPSIRATNPTALMIPENAFCAQEKTVKHEKIRPPAIRRT